MDEESQALVFEALKQIMAPYEPQLTVVSDTPANYHLDTSHIMANKKPMFFGAVQIKKRYVSYHLMPVYVEPSLLKAISEPLRKKMQGKSCFNFTKVQPDLFAELALLTEAGYQFYVSKRYIQLP